MATQSRTNHATMTSEQLGRRMDHVEKDVGMLKTEVARTTAEVQGMRGDIGVMFSKLDQVISSSVDNAATKGHVPTGYIWSGLALIATLVSIGMGMLTFSSNAIRGDMNDDAEKDRLRMEGMVALEEKRQEVVKEQVANLQHVDALRDAELLDLHEQQVLLRIMQARLDERTKFVTGELDQHEGKADHPFRQTYELQQLHQEMEQLRELVDRIDTEGRRVWNKAAPAGALPPHPSEGGE